MDAFSAIGLAVLGWMLNEISHRFRANAQRRAALGRALVELLEVHHAAKFMVLIFTKIRPQYGMSAAELVQGVDFLERIIPPDPQLSDRYNAAVTEIATTHPVLAYRLRGREQLPRIFANIRSIASPEEFAVLNELLNPIGLATMEEIIVSVARAHGWSSWWQTRQRVKRPVEVPQEITALIEAAKTKLSESAALKKSGGS